MKFSQMPYSRPDIQKEKEEIENCVARLKAAKSFAEADDVFHRLEESSCVSSTMFALASVRQKINTEDPFYSGETAFIDENGPLLQESQQAWGRALLASPYRKEFAEKYGDLMFRNIEIYQKTFSPEIVSELQEENRLKTEYTNLIASAQIPFEGNTYTIAQFAPVKQDTDRERRLAAWKAEGQFFEENGAELDRIFDELTALRTNMARKLGYKDFTELGYYRMCRNSYTKEDVKRFREAVVKHIVPVVAELKKARATRVGVPYPTNFADSALAFSDGNAKPQGTPEEILAHGRKMYQEMSPETHEFIDFMFENELFDVLSRNGKAGGGFCTKFSAYKSPFIFANFNGTAHDVEVITHEAGHAFASYTLRDVFPSSNRSYTMETAEIHSMSMEFFAWPWAEGFFGKDTDKFRYSHLSGALCLLPYTCLVDHFQHENYENPDMTSAQRHETWQRLLGTYMPWVKLGEIPFYGEGKNWQKQQHIYNFPFYYIDYALAQAVALQFWTMAQENAPEAWKAYNDLVQSSGTRTFTEILEAAGLEQPFEGDSLRKIAETAAAWLESFDLEKLN